MYIGVAYTRRGGGVVGCDWSTGASTRKAGVAAKGNVTEELFVLNLPLCCLCRVMVSIQHLQRGGGEGSLVPGPKSGPSPRHPRRRPCPSLRRSAPRPRAEAQGRDVRALGPEPRQLPPRGRLRLRPQRSGAPGPPCPCPRRALSAGADRTHPGQPPSLRPRPRDAGSR